MIRWFTVWGGHVVVGLAIGFFGLTMFFAWQAARSYDHERIMLFFVCTMIAFLVAVITLAVGVYLYNDLWQRRYLRNEAMLASPPAPLGDGRQGARLLVPGVGKRRAQQAHTADQEASRNGD